MFSDPRIPSEDWMLIGRQEETGHGGRIDLLVIAPDLTLVLIEVKRSRTPREVVAQALSNRRSPRCAQTTAAPTYSSLAGYRTTDVEVHSATEDR